MPSIAFTSLAEKVLALYAPPMAETATRRQMRQILRELGELGLKRSYDLDEQAIARWMTAHVDDPKRGPARTESLLRCIRRIVNYGLQKRFLREDPFKIKPLRQWIRADAGTARRRPKRSKTGAEMRKLLDVVDRHAAAGAWNAGRLQALVYIYAFTGLRRDEALHILARNVNLDARTLKLEPVGKWRPKTVRSARTIPLADPVVEVLRKWLPRCGADPFASPESRQGRIWLFMGRRLTAPWRGGNGYKPIDQIRAAAAEAGIGDMTPIGFRKSLGTNSKAMGLGGLERAELLGHANKETAEEWYDEERIESMRPGIAKIVSFYLPQRPEPPRAVEG
jgi:integrase